LKPGGHLLAFGGTRTWHRLAVAVEDAGFEIRDNIAWLYGSGFPKSHNISKAIDKAAGAEREIIGKLTHPTSTIPKIAMGDYWQKDPMLTASATDDAKKWDGWGTALKPAHEPIVVARKPLIGTVAQNVLQHGVGGINVDACRIGTTVETWPISRNYSSRAMSRPGSTLADDAETQLTGDIPAGRWPANIILDEHTAELLDQQSGITKSGDINPRENNSQSSIFGNGKGLAWKGVTGCHKGDSGGASRFFYVAKASKRDRNEGLDQLQTRHNGKMMRPGNNTQEKASEGFERFNTQPSQNFHPTVKPTALMQYLIRIVTPNNGVVLDPFAGAGSTGKAAILENKHFIGIEVTPEYLPIIEGRLTHAYETLDSKEDLF
jgi:site-specific DNA-methyltransferase (adenine-specific)